MTLTEFLLARIAEDEEVARDAAGWDLSGRQRASGQWSRVGMGSIEDDQRQSVVYSDNKQVSGGVADHIARHDPARVLAECEAKRRIVEWHTETEDCCEERWGPMQWATDENISAGTDALGNLSIRRDIGGEEWLGCVTLAHLAAVYADHPDYREEWKP